MDVKLAFLPFPEGRKVVAVAVIDFIIFAILKFYTEDGKLAPSVSSLCNFDYFGLSRSSNYGYQCSCSLPGIPGFHKKWKLQSPFPEKSKPGKIGNSKCR